MRTASWVVLLAIGCSYQEPPPRDDVGGQSGTAHPPFCVEDARVAVDDPAVAADGFDFAVVDVLADVEGTWEGEGELAGTGGGQAVVDVDVAWDGGLVEAVYSHLEEGDTTMEMGAPGVSECPPRYELGFTLHLQAPPFLDAVGGARVAADGLYGLEIPVSVDESVVGGTLEPPVWDHPEFWDRTALSMVWSQREVTALALDWWAINDDAARSAGTGVGGTSTGTVEPSGQNSPIVYLADLVRL